MKKNNCLKGLITFPAVSVACIMLLLFSAYLPQENIARNIDASVPGLRAEGLYPKLRGTAATTLDNYTEALILMSVRATDSSDISGIISNPLFLYEEDPLSSLESYINDPSPVPNGYYVRYWQGFRVTLRALFSFFTYSTIRLITAAVLAGLTLLAMISVAKHANIPTALSLGLTILIMHPLIIARSFQYSSCFLIALTALIFIPFFRDKSIGLYFMVIGMLTQFFDFYTVPVLTFGLPAVYYFSFYSVEKGTSSILHIFRLFGMWFIGYFFFWIEKLILASVFSPLDGFYNGFSELMIWMGSESSSFTVDTILAAFRKTFSAMVSGDAAKLLLAFGALSVVSLSVKYSNDERVRYNKQLLFLSLIPLIWIFIAAKPSANHAFFQYRSLAVSIWGIFSFFTSSIIDENLKLHYIKK